MTAAISVADTYMAAFEQFERTRGIDSPEWLAPVREAGRARFAELGFPTTHHEDWRFTNLAPLVRTRFAWPENAEDEPDLSVLLPHVWELGEPRLVFLNGRFCSALSRGGTSDVRVVPLTSALAEDPAEVARHLARHASARDDAFVALNTAFLADGAYVRVAPGVQVEAPLHLVFVMRAAGQPALACPRTLIVVGENARCSIVESYVGVDGAYFTNAVTELVVGDNAAVDHYKVQREADTAFHIGTLCVHEQRSTNVRSHCISLGGRLVRHNVNTVLAGEGGECHLNGLYVVGGDQHVDNHLRVDHVAPHCDSREIYKGLLAGSARAVFTGRIVVHPGAQKTDAKQTNHNLLLSGAAQVDTKPQLEIRADDVKCTHGATIGQLNDDAMFYLRARGIPEDAARDLLTYAFAADSLDQIHVPTLRTQAEAAVRTRLPLIERLESAP